MFAAAAPKPGGVAVPGPMPLPGAALALTPASAGAAAAAPPNLFGATTGPGVPGGFNLLGTLAAAPGAAAAVPPQAYTLAAYGVAAPVAAPPPNALAAATATTLLPQKEIQAIAEALIDAPDNPRYRFRALLHNIVPDAAARQKPPGVDELKWREAIEECGGERNPEHLWPVLHRGFGELCARYGEQKKALEAQEEAIARAGRELAARQRRRDVAIVARLERLREEHAAQAHRLLRAARLCEALDARTAPWQAAPFAGDEAALRARAASLRAALDAGGGELARKVDALRAAARAAAPQNGNSIAGGGGGVGAPPPPQNAGPQLEAESLAQLASLLSGQSNALRTLADVLKRDTRDVAIVERARGGGDGGSEPMRM
jgi:nuclear pore complex protein Nup54